MQPVAIVVIVLAAGAAACDERPVAAQPARERHGFSARGRVEGASETTTLAAAMDGIVARVNVAAGDAVAARQALVHLDCEERLAAVRALRARVASQTAIKARLIRGARDEDRRKATAEREQARALADWAAAHHARLRALYEQDGVVSREAVEKAHAEAQASSAALAAAIAHLELTEAGPLPEEMERIDREIVESQARISEAEARVDQCDLRAPSHGTVLRILVRPGEAVSQLSGTPMVMMADLSRLRIRAEVDEQDAPRVRRSARARISAGQDDRDAMPGVVTWIAPAMGRKRVTSPDPDDHFDRDVREVLLDVSADARLAVGQRVVVFFEPE